MELTIEQALQQGITAHREGKLQDAERLYRAILQSQPAHPDANHNLGVLAVSANKPGAALPLFKNALESNPKIEQFWLSYIDALIQEKQFELAKQVLDQAKKQGLEGETLNALGVKLASKNEADDIIDESPSQEQLSNLLEYYQNGRFADAEQVATSITREYPKHQFAWKVLGAVLGKTGRKFEAVNASQTAIALSPQDAAAHCNLGNTLKELGRLDEAEASYNQAIALKPDFPEAHYNLGNTLKELGRLDDADASYTQALALKPDYAAAYYNLGITLQELMRLDEAEVSYNQAIALKPDYTNAHYNLGNTLQKLGRLDEAEVSYTQAIALKPEFFLAYTNLGNTLKELGRLDEAEASLTQAIALKPDYAEAYYSLGITLKELGRLDEAEANFKQVVVLRPDFSQAKHMLAACTGDVTATAPRDYVEELFDSYAAKFESSLVDNLEYKIPRLIAEMITRDSKFDLLGSIIDLGCGTGLFGMEIKQFCGHLEGIDLSEKMLDEAKGKCVYNKLIKQDIITYLSNENLNFDYFIATDVFVYIGDLRDVFRLIKSRNKTGGKLAFSTEDYDGDGFFLEQSGRYSHSKTYIESLCKNFGYELRHFETQPLRKDKTQFITGGLYLLDF